jgi:hypothetical protein
MGAGLGIEIHFETDNDSGPDGSSPAAAGENSSERSSIYPGVHACMKMFCGLGKSSARGCARSLLLAE